MRYALTPCLAMGIDATHCTPLRATHTPLRHACASASAHSNADGIAGDKCIAPTMSMVALVALGSMRPMAGVCDMPATMHIVRTRSNASNISRRNRVDIDRKNSAASRRALDERLDGFSMAFARTLRSLSFYSIL